MRRIDAPEFVDGCARQFVATIVFRMIAVTFYFEKFHVVFLGERNQQPPQVLILHRLPRRVFPAAPLPAVDPMILKRLDQDVYKRQGPKSDGTIGAEDAAILKAVGAWLRVIGEAVYHSHVWRAAQEGPTRVQEGQFTDGVAKAYTGEDFRFTCRGGAIYAVAMACPADGVLRIRSLARWDGKRPLPCLLYTS